MYKSCRSQGFTLIELMIVIGILGILMALALPAYKDYTVRTKVAEAINRAGGLKAAVASYYNTKRSFPTSMADMGLANETDPSAYVTYVHIYRGYLCIDMKNTGEPTIDDFAHSIRLKPTFQGGSVSWQCGHSPGVADRFFPASCRNIINL